MNHHLAILKKPYLDAILTGRKTIESRLYQTRQKWLSQVIAGDKIFLKASSGPVMATATVDKVKCFENLTAGQIAQMQKQYNQQILGDEQYWRDKANSRCGILVWLKEVRPIPNQLIKKFDWRAWVALTPKENFGLLASK
ncbi:MAG: ASCH domain-containing protein [Sedimentisphaerales bacterium]|jgi:ASC-1-like (ASCH) protein